MKRSSCLMALDFQVAAGFEEARQKLLAAEFADRLERPLAFWAQAGDRNLPLALIGRSVRDLLNTPLQQLYATPGVGPKKFAMLVRLVARAAQPHPPGAELPPQEEPASGTQAEGGAGLAQTISEALWTRWRASVVDHNLGHETLGRFAASLQQLPRAIWKTRLDFYTGLTLAEIRALKAHGEKRINGILEVFGDLHHVLVHLGTRPHLTARVQPRFVENLEAWLARQFARGSCADADELHRDLIDPILAQVGNDVGQQVARLAADRIGLTNFSVQQQARRLGLTRGRVYELLAEVPTVLNVRWPEGRALLGRLNERARSSSPAAARLLTTACAVFYPADAQWNGSLPVASVLHLPVCVSG